MPMIILTTFVLPPRIAADGCQETPVSADGAIYVDQLSRLVATTGENRQQKTVYCPFNGEVLGRVPMCSAEDIQAALKRARTAQAVWARRTFQERQAIFLRYHDLILCHREQLLDLIQLEGGKARLHALEEVLDVALTSRHYAFHAGDYLKARRRKPALPLLTTTRVYHHPVGVVGIISPWNYPLTLAISDAIPALMAGNSVLLKPAEETPLTALYAVQLLREAGLPHELLQVITGRGSIIGPALIQNVDFISFTGSTATGRMVARQAGERLIQASLELGGKNPIIILADADLDRAVEATIRGSFSNAGQLCIAFERVYVQAGIYDRFVARLLQRVRALRLGPALDYSVDMGSLVSQDQLDKVTDHVEDALAKGATLLAGGRPRPELGPYFYEPTLLVGVTPGMKVYAEETFGPVVSIYRFERVEEAIRLANDSRYGLNAAIWTRDTRRGWRLARQIQAGTVNINESYAATWGSIDAPMGGMKESGLGRRHGAEGILKYTETQTIAVQRLLPIAPFGWFKPAAFALVLTLLLWVFKRIPGLR